MAIGEFPNQFTTNWPKNWSETIVFSNQLRQLPQMVTALDKIQVIYFTSSPKYVTSSAVAMEILCITNIGSNSSEKLVGGEKLL